MSQLCDKNMVRADDARSPARALLNGIAGAPSGRALITDGDDRAALAAARSLVAAGWEVHVTAPARRSLAGVARGVRGWRVASDALIAPHEYTAEISRLAGAVGAQVVLPISDPSVDAILEHRDALPAHATVPFPSLSAHRAASDKERVMALACSAGFAVPDTHTITSPADGEGLLDERLFPAVIKPHRSVIQAPSGRAKLGVTFVDDVESCRRVLRTLPLGAFPVLLQRRVRGPGEGLFVLRWDGRLVAVFAHRRLRERPPAGGVSVYRESIAPGFRFLRAGLRLLEALEWNGLAMIECKRDLATGRHVIMEVNGRFWGSLQLAIDAGVDFPLYLARCALGQVVPTIGKYRVGIRSRWFWGDVDHLYLRLRRSAAELHLDSGAPSRRATVADFFRFAPGRDRWEVWRWFDPAPFLLETARRLTLTSR
jgi:predicted ATP-grasp superfamily ATP-dependent carboligase